MPYPTIQYTVHAAEHLVGRGIRRREVEAVLNTGERIEDYPDDPRGASCLMLGRVGGDEAREERPLHIVAADDDNTEETTIITMYEPDPAKWSDDFRTRQ